MTARGPPTTKTQSEQALKRVFDTLTTLSIDCWKRFRVARRWARRINAILSNPPIKLLRVNPGTSLGIVSAGFAVRFCAGFRIFP